MYPSRATGVLSTQNSTAQSCGPYPWNGRPDPAWLGEAHEICEVCMTRFGLPVSLPPDPNTRAPRWSVPKGACDTHAHIFGPPDIFPYSDQRRYTPPAAPLEHYRNVQKITGLSRAVFVTPTAHGYDNRVILDAIAKIRRFGAWDREHKLLFRDQGACRNTSRPELRALAISFQLLRAYLGRRLLRGILCLPVERNGRARCLHVVRRTRRIDTLQRRSLPQDGALAR